MPIAYRLCCETKLLDRLDGNVAVYITKFQSASFQLNVDQSTHLSSTTSTLISRLDGALSRVPRASKFVAFEIPWSNTVGSTRESLRVKDVETVGFSVSVEMHSLTVGREKVTVVPTSGVDSRSRDPFISPASYRILAVVYVTSDP